MYVFYTVRGMSEDGVVGESIRSGADWGNIVRQTRSASLLRRTSQALAC